MAHFAKVDQGKVIRVIVASQEFIDTYVDNIPGEWIQTSYNTRGGIHYDPQTQEPSEDQSKALRWNYASVGGHYDSENDAFYSRQPFSSWSLDENFIWQPPVAYPDDGELYTWNEETQTWDAVESE